MLKKLVAVNLSLLIIMVFLLVIIPSAVITRYPGPSNLIGETILPLTSSSPLVINIDPPKYLNSISVFLKNPLIQDNHYIYFQLIQNGLTIRNLVFNGQNVGDPSWLTAKFEPLSAQQPITITFTTENKNDQSLYYYSGPDYLPLYSSTFQIPSFKDRLIYQTKLKQNQLLALNKQFLFAYLFLLSIIEYLLLKNDRKTY